MDSAKTLLPHWVRIPKTVKPDMLLKYHLTCVKYDGYRPDDIYYCTNTIPHDSSTTKIPYIKIHMDNTVKEDKNRNVAALCNWLVSIGICDVIHLVFLPVRHTHERVDQIFIRISLALSRSSAYTIEAFLDLVAKAFSPTPEIAELSFSLDFSEWLRPHFQDHIQDIMKPHKFEFTRDDAAASGGSMSTALWSNTPLSEPVQIFKNVPIGTPEIHLNNAEAARVEAEVRAQVLQDDSAFQGVHAGAKERLHDNTSPSDAKGSNLVVIDVSDVHEEDKCPETLGDWESRFVIGLVKSRETTEDTLTVAAYEPFHTNAKGKPLMPLWLYAQTKGGKKPVDTNWEKCLTLPWKLVEAVPLSYAKAIHDASGSREVFNEDGTMVRKKWYGKSVHVVKTYAQTRWQISQPRNNCVHVMSTTPAQRKPGGVVKFNAATKKDLLELGMLNE
eukprot:jgi/Tetstr1/431922/TSEL_021411.t1